MSTDIVDIGLRVDSSGVAHGRRELDKFGHQAGKTQTATKKLGLAIKGALVGAIAGLVVSLKKALSVFIEFDKSIKELSAITGATGKDLQFYTKQSLEMAKATGYSASEVVKAFKLIASAKPDLLESKEALASVTQEVLTLARAGSMELEEAAVALGASLNQFGAGAEEASRFINVLAAGAKFGSSEIRDTTEALRMAGTVAHNAGLSFEETSAQIQILADKNIKGAWAGTGFKTVMLKLTTQTKDQFNPAVVGITQAMLNLDKANLSATESVKLFGTEGVVAANAMISGAKASEELTKKLTGTNTATEQAATNSSSLSVQIDTMDAAWEAASITIMTKVEPAIKLAIELLTSLADKVAPATSKVVGFVEGIGIAYAKTYLKITGQNPIIKAAEDIETLDEQITNKRSSILRLAEALNTYLNAYEAASNKIKEIESADPGDRRLKGMRAAQSRLQDQAFALFEQLKKAREELEQLKAMDIVTIDITQPGGTEPPKAKTPRGPTAGELAAKKLAFEQEQDWLEELDAMEKEYKDQKFQEEQDWLEELDAMEKEYQDQKFQQKLDYLQGIDHEEEYYASKSLERDKQINELKKQAQSNFWSDMISLGSSGSKKLFDIGKIAAVANAVVDGYAAATSAWRVGMATGPWTAAAYMAASIAKTAGLIKSITSASFSGGSKSMSAGGGGGSPTSGTGSAAEPITPVAQTATVMHDVSIVVSGGLHSDEDVRNLVERINEIREDMGGNVNFVPS